MVEFDENPTKTSRDIKVGTSQNIAQCGQPLAIFQPGGYQVAKYFLRDRQPVDRTTTFAIFIDNGLSKVEILSLTQIGKWLFLARWLTFSQLFYDNFEHIHEDYNVAEFDKNPTTTS